jgi:cobalt-zinc-cadmium resistance protein CzcA
VENIVAHLAHDDEKAKTQPIQKVLWAVQEVASPVSIGIVIIALVFLPLLTLEGLEGWQKSPKSSALWWKNRIAWLKGKFT